MKTNFKKYLMTTSLLLKYNFYKLNYGKMKKLSSFMTFFPLSLRYFSEAKVLFALAQMHYLLKIKYNQVVKIVCF